LLRQNQAIHGERRSGREEESRIQKENPATAKGSTVKECRVPSGNSTFLSSYPVLATEKASTAIHKVIYT
jgi:hypothetical protein